MAVTVWWHSADVVTQWIHRHQVLAIEDSAITGALVKTAVGIHGI